MFLRIYVVPKMAEDGTDNYKLWFYSFEEMTWVCWVITDDKQKELSATVLSTRYPPTLPMQILCNLFLCQNAKVYNF